MRLHIGVNNHTSVQCGSDQTVMAGQFTNLANDHGNRICGDKLV